MTDRGTRDTRSELEEENERLRMALELVKERNGWELFRKLDRRLNRLTAALNEASRMQRARRWLRRKLRPDAEPLYHEAMSNMASAVAQAAVETLVNGRWAVREHENAEELREALSWALDMIDMYDEHLAEHDGEEAVYTQTHLAGKAKARGVLEGQNAEREDKRVPVPRQDGEGDL